MLRTARGRRSKRNGALGLRLIHDWTIPFRGTRNAMDRIDQKAACMRRRTRNEHTKCETKCEMRNAKCELRAPLLLSFQLMLINGAMLGNAPTSTVRHFKFSFG